MDGSPLVSTKPATFTTPDTHPGTTGQNGTHNRHTYGLNNPTRHSDPTGRVACYDQDCRYTTTSVSIAEDLARQTTGAYTGSNLAAVDYLINGYFNVPVILSDDEAETGLGTDDETIRQIVGMAEGALTGQFPGAYQSYEWRNRNAAQNKTNLRAFFRTRGQASFAKWIYATSLAEDFRSNLSEGHVLRKWGTGFHTEGAHEAAFVIAAYTQISEIARFLSAETADALQNGGSVGGGVLTMAVTPGLGKAVRSAAKGGVSVIRSPVHHIATNKNWISPNRGGPWTPRFKKLFDGADLDLDDQLNKISIPGHKGGLRG